MDIKQQPVLGDNSMETVGEFLDIILENFKTPQRCAKMITPPPYGHNMVLHHTPNYRQLQLVQLIISIYNGLPESFQVFHCHSNSTQEELNLFLQRIEMVPLTYLILEVNTLPYALQEVCPFYWILWL